jgi:hypothetical protein
MDVTATAPYGKNGRILFIFSGIVVHVQGAGTKKKILLDLMLLKVSSISSRRTTSLFHYYEVINKEVWR